MKFTEINAKFTEVVTKYLNEGYTICTTTMSGSQGEMAKIDLMKGKELIRVWMNREASYNWLDGNVFHGTILVVRASKWNYPVEDFRRCDTVWMSDLTHIEEYNYYEISRLSWYVDNIDEAIEYQKKRCSRYRSYGSTTEYYTSDRAKQFARNYMMKHHGYSRISNDKLSIKKTDNRYYVVYADKSYRVN